MPVHLDPHPTVEPLVLCPCGCVTCCPRLESTGTLLMWEENLKALKVSLTLFLGIPINGCESLQLLDRLTFVVVSGPLLQTLLSSLIDEPLNSFARHADALVHTSAALHKLVA